MHKKNMYKVIIAIAVALVFITPVAVVANDEGSTNNSEIVTEIDSTDLCPLLYYEVDDADITIDTSDLGVLGDTFYAYMIWVNIDPYNYSYLEGTAYFDSENPGSITFLRKTKSPEFIAGCTWAEDTWYGCQFNNGWLWTIDEVTGTMTKIGGEGSALNGLAYDPITNVMYGASNTALYTINMSNGKQTLVGLFNTGGMIIGIAFDGEGNIYGEDLNDNLYSVNTLTGKATLIGPLGIDINYAQDMAYDIDNDVLYLAAYTGSGGQLYTCNVTTGACTLVGNFPGGDTEITEITGLAIPYTPKQHPDTPDRPEGPTEGVVGVEYTFSTRTTDPEGDQVYYLWGWGDGTSSEWLGPFDSGVMVYTNHTWMEAEMYYEVRVKAKNVYNRESDWSNAKTIYIVGMPILEIGNITGGLFKVNTVIRNRCSVNAIRVNWSITLNSANGGFILLGKETSGSIVSIPAGEEKAIISSLIFGFGKTVIMVSVETDGSSDTKEQEAFVLLFLITI